MLNDAEQKLFKNRLAESPQIGTFIKIDSPEIIEIAGMAGLNFIIIDMEHTTLEFRQVEQMVRTADLHRMSTIVRIPDGSRSSIARALDLGATGIQVPQLDDANEVAAVVDKAKYPPFGSRGLTYAHRAARFGYRSTDRYMEEENEKSMVVVHIETVNAFENVDEISRVEGLDVVFIGPQDLSVSLGVGANYMNGELAAPVKRILDVCRTNGTKTGIAVANEEQYRFAVEQRIPYIVWSSDVALMKQAFDRVIKIRSTIL